MNIGLDLQPLVKQKTGIGYYTSYIAKHLYEELYNSNSNVYGLCFDFLNLYKFHEKLSTFDFDVKLNTKMHYGIYRRLWGIIPVSYNFFFPVHTDLVHFFNYIVPPKVNGKIVVTIYDMVLMRYPDTMNNRNYRNLKKNLMKSAMRADLIVTISENSKKEIVEYLKVNEKKIVIVSPAVDHLTYLPIEHKESQEQVRKKYNLPESFILYLGTLEPRKNIERLVKAYSKLPIRIQEKYKLVIAGGKGWKFETIFEEVDKLSLKDKVIFAGYVDEIDKPMIYNLAELFVFPSLYEGFGMPPLEAMACGTPVIVSEISSLPEVVGDAGILINPYDTEDLAEKITLVLQNDSLRNLMIEKSLIQAKQFSWKKSVHVLLEAYRRIV